MPKTRERSYLIFKFWELNSCYFRCHICPFFYTFIFYLVAFMPSLSNITHVYDKYASIPLYVFLINGAETGQIIFALLFTPLAVSVFLKRSLCHRNLAYLIMSSFFLYFILLLNRLAMCIYGFTDSRVLCKLICLSEKIRFIAERSLLIAWYPVRYFDQARIFAGYTAAIQVGLIVIERCVCTVNMHSYETRSDSIILFAAITATYCFGIYASFLIFQCGSILTCLRTNI
jgi:hypothetical protein